MDRTGIVTVGIESPPEANLCCRDGKTMTERQGKCNRLGARGAPEVRTGGAPYSARSSAPLRGHAVFPFFCLFFVVPGCGLLRPALRPAGCRTLPVRRGTGLGHANTRGAERAVAPPDGSLPLLPRLGLFLLGYPAHRLYRRRLALPADILQVIRNRFLRNS